MTVDIPRHKRELRRTLKHKRDSLAPSYLIEASKAICLLGIDWIEEQMGRSSIVQSDVSAFGYLPTGSEVDLMNLQVHLAHKIPIGIPRILSNTEMEFKKWMPGDPTSLSRFNISEPLTTAPSMNVNEHAIVFIPALAADIRGYRLVYGGGYYDRYLSQSGPCIKVVVLYASMMVEGLQTEAHDIPADFILTEDGILAAVTST